MRLEELYPLTGFVLTRIIKNSSGIVLLEASSTSRSAICPYCHALSCKRHSTYIRKPCALPCSDTSIQLALNVQRYFCLNPACNHRTFAERIPAIAHFYARQTIQLEALLKIVAFEMSAETASRVFKSLKIQVSPDRILRLIRKTVCIQGQEVRVLGVDDWAFKKGQNYGTLLVDLEKHPAIELLSDRTQNTLCEWLQKHPEIQIISRDRSFEYKAGIEAGSPQAIQIVDRWHLLHNLQEKLQEIIPNQLAKKKSETGRTETSSYPKRKKYFELVNQLHARGFSQRRITRILGISRGTVRRYLEEPDVPKWYPRKQAPSHLDVYENYLRLRWQSGSRDISQLWKELQQKGYMGKRKSVAEYLQRFRAQTPFRSAHQLAWIFMKDANRLQEEEKLYLMTLFIGNQKLQEIYELAQSFQTMLSKHVPDMLDDCLIQMENSGVKKLQNFALGLRQDYDAVKAALSYDWSNGQVEGQCMGVSRAEFVGEVRLERQVFGKARSKFAEDVRQSTIQISVPG